PNAGDFYRFRVTGALLPGRQSGEEPKIINHGKRRSKRANEIFLAEGINPILDSHAGVALAESRGGNPHMPNAAVSRGSRQPNLVQQRSSTYRNHVRMPVQVEQINGAMDFGHVSPRTFRFFATLANQRGTYQVHRRTMHGKISGYD